VFVKIRIYLNVSLLLYSHNIQFLLASRTTKRDPKSVGIINLTFIGPCIANIFAEYNQHDAMFHNLFISVVRSTCFRRYVQF